MFFFFTLRERLDSGEEKDTEVLVETAVAEAATEMEAAMIPDFFMSRSSNYLKFVDSVYTFFLSVLNK